MTNDDIKRAAYKYAGDVNRNRKSGIEPYSVVDFMEGAKWRVNGVWHDERKTPNKSDLILVEFPDGRFDIVYFHSIKSWRSMVKRNGTIRWAYLEDLKPDKEK